MNNVNIGEEESKRANIHLTRWGAGERIVLVHGGARGGPVGGAATFAAQRPLADASYELVLPDRPGHGLSPAGEQREDFELDAVWVAELLGDGAHLVGHSYGAAVVVACAARQPARVRSVTLIEAPIFSVAPDDLGAQRLAAELAAAIAQPDELLTLLAFVQAAGIPVGVLEPVPDPGELMAMARGLKAMRQPVTWDAGPALATIASARIPALVVTGGWSPGFEAIGDALATVLHGRRLVVDAGHHLPHLADGRAGGGAAGAEFNDAVLAFLRGG